VALTGEEIRARLQAFAARWSVYEGSERGEAQTFLNELFECYGASREKVGTCEQRQAGGFVDLIRPEVYARSGDPAPSCGLGDRLGAVVPRLAVAAQHRPRSRLGDLVERAERPLRVGVRRGGDDLRAALAAVGVERDDGVAAISTSRSGKWSEQCPSVWPGVKTTRGLPGTSSAPSS